MTAAPDSGPGPERRGGPQPPTPAEATPAEGAGDSTATNADQRKPRKRRRWRRLFAWLLAVTVIARIVLGIFLPDLVAYGVTFAGLAGRCANAELSLLGGSVRLQGLELHDPDDPEHGPRLTLLELGADVSTWQLLQGDIVIDDAVLRSAQLVLHRRADRSFVLPAAWTAPSPEPEPEPESEPEAGPMSTELPLRIATARIHDLRLRIVELDGRRAPIDVVLDLDIDDVGSRDVPGHLELRLAADGVADRVVIGAQFDTPGKDAEGGGGGIRVDSTILAHGLDLAPLVPAAEQLGVIDVELAAKIALLPDPAVPDGARLQTTLELHDSPAIARTLTADVGATFDAAGGMDCSAAIDATGIVLEPLAELLRASGVTFVEDGIDASARASARLPGADPEAATPAGMDLRVHDVRVGTGDDVITLTDLTVEQLRQTGDGLHIAAVRAVGPTASAAQRPDGSLAIAGIRFGAAATPTGAGTGVAPTSEPAGPVAEPAGPVAEPAADPAADPAAGPAATGAALPTIILDELDWRSATLALLDQRQPDAEPLTVEVQTLTGQGLACACDRDEGTANLHVRVPGIADALRVQLQVTPQAGGAHVEGDIELEDLTTTGLARWLAPLGIEPTFATAQLRTDLVADIGGAGENASASGRIANLRFTTGDDLLLGLKNLELDDLRLHHEGLKFASVSAAEPIVRIERSNAAMTVAGLRFGRPSAAPAHTTPPATPQPATPKPGAPAGPARPLVLDTGPITLERATVHLHDTGPNPRTSTIGVDLELGAIAGTGLAAFAQPVPFALTVHLDERVEALGLRGQLARTQDQLTVSGTLDGTGIRGTALTRLLPDGMRSPLANGRIGAELEVHIAPGMSALDVAVREFALHDGDEELAAIDRIEFVAPQLGSDTVHIEKAVVAGVRAKVEKSAAGLLVPGLLIADAAAPVDGEPAQPNAPSPNAPSPAEAAPTSTEPATVPPPISVPTTRAPGAGLPALRIDELAVALDELVWHDRTVAGSEPLRTALRIELAAPWRTAEELDETAPLELRIRGGAAPIVSEIALDLLLEPFALAPVFDAKLTIDGIDTTAIEQIAPAMRETLTGTETGARLTLHTHAEIDLARTDPTQFDLSRPFGGAVLVEDLEFTATDGEPLIRVPALDVTLRAFDPRTGDVLLRSVDLDAPHVVVHQGKDGLQVAGVTLRPSPAAPAGGEPAAEAPTPRTAAELDAERRRGPAPEFAVDDFSLFGLSVRFTDDTTDPPTLVPIDELDVSLRRFSTRTLTESRQFAFDVTLRGGDVPLEKRVAASSVLSGIVGSTADLVTFRNDEHAIEQRSFVDEILIDGYLQLHPMPLGHVTTVVHGFELQTLRGLAKPSGVDIADGLFDARIDAELTQRGTRIESQKTFTFLQVSEPPGGPISTYLKLPAPLDVVLFILRNDNGEQRLPMQLEVPRTGDLFGGIATAAVETLTLLIGDAIGSSPYRAARTLTDIFGITGQDAIDATPAALEFAPGSATTVFEPLAKLLTAYGDDPTVSFVITHELGQQDYDRVAELSNPDRALAEQSVARLQLERQNLRDERTRIAPEVTARLLAGQEPAARRKIERLREIDAELAAITAALDAAATLFDGSSDRHQKRRARRAAIELGELRIATVRAELEARLGPGIGDRLQIRRPRGVIAADRPEGGRVTLVPRRANH